MSQLSILTESELNQTQDSAENVNKDSNNDLDIGGNDDDNNLSDRIPLEENDTFIETNSLHEFHTSQEFQELNPLYLPDNYDKLPESFDISTFPQSHKQNNLKESQLLEYCENFCRQYAHLCPDRTKLFLIPMNECDIQKFVCTTLSKTYLNYPELYLWYGAAKFVADFLNFVPLVPSTELPKRLLSPMTTVNLQKGTCFEYATLLCSLLIAAGYDAYVVSGYATRECCYMDETRETCPFLIGDEVKETTDDVENEEVEPKRYIIKPEKDLTSKYEHAMTMKDLQFEAERVKQARKEAELAEEERYKPTVDPLFGLRIHAWVLILPGKREVPEAFFVETLTGLAKPLDCSMYLGIESLWNDHNYWVNMQDCSTGISHLNYNLNDSLCWEYLLPNDSLSIERTGFSSIQRPDMFNLQSTMNSKTPTTNHLVSPLLIVPNSLKSKDNNYNSSFNLNDNDAHCLIDSAHQVRGNVHVKSLGNLQNTPLQLDLPPSWTLPIQIEQKLFKLHYPNGLKKKQYKYSIVENFAPYSQRDGLILKLTIFQDRELTNPIEVRETYANRKDKLISRSTILRTNWIVEKFDHGRETSHLIEHGYYKTQQGVHTIRYMIFNHDARTDGLYKREQTFNTMIEHFKDRHDCLYYREVHFSAKAKKFGPAPTQNKDNPDELALSTTSQLNIDKIIERFIRNEEIEADEDIAEKIFNITEERISLTYHVGKERIVPCTREFNKPPPSDDRRDGIQLYPDTHVAFQVNLFNKPKTQIEIYNMLITLLDEEEKSKEFIYKSIYEIHSILNERTIEDLHVTIDIDPFDTLHNIEIHELRNELEKLAKNQQNYNSDIEIDYLQPYLIQYEMINNKLTKEQALLVRNECLNDFKQTLINKVNIIQLNYEKEQGNLIKKQQWYQLNQMNLTKQDEQDYLVYCHDVTLKINTLQSLINWYKLKATEKYEDLEKKLKSDARLSELLL
ncbi:Dynein regulatory complex subunit 7 [Schistosoma haematobium]|uniref:Coiled-coil domain-containing protein lobo-like protein n=1 Tax=Schistosoma haematobium TaxID=6185 RepID=A0A094ZSR8_SCHHA|nr:Dynein regulatory complex subunit 7 [Schistosoma haematobium]KAH9593703.1 Dynein regulatory complex subunit 7 [Schistosoma haematobium]